MTSQEYFDPYLSQVISEEKFIYKGLSNDQLDKRIKVFINK